MAKRNLPLRPWIDQEVFQRGKELGIKGPVIDLAGMGVDRRFYQTLAEGIRGVSDPYIAVERNWKTYQQMKSSFAALEKIPDGPRIFYGDLYNIAKRLHEEEGIKFSWILHCGTRTLSKMWFEEDLVTEIEEIQKKGIVADSSAVMLTFCRRGEKEKDLARGLANTDVHEKIRQALGHFPHIWPIGDPWHYGSPRTGQACMTTMLFENVHTRQEPVNPNDLIDKLQELGPLTLQEIMAEFPDKSAGMTRDLLKILSNEEGGDAQYTSR